MRIDVCTHMRTVSWDDAACLRAKCGAEPLPREGVVSKEHTTAYSSLSDRLVLLEVQCTRYTHRSQHVCEVVASAALRVELVRIHLGGDQL